MKILAVNAGSSSLKMQLLEMPEETLIAKAQVERIGLENAVVTVKYDFDENGKGKTWEIRDAVINGHPDAVKAVMDKFSEFNIIENVDDIKGVGHRMVQGGEDYCKTEEVTEDVSRTVLELAELAPLHNKPEHDGYVAFKQIIPNAIHTFVFDTAFHQSIPEERYIYPIPYEYYEKYKMRRYGFHGTSHKYIASFVREFMGKDEYKAISCHLGSGASICAIKDGKSVDTTMGFTPLAGIAMGTRSGDLDPSILTYIMNKEGLTADEMNKILKRNTSDEENPRYNIGGFKVIPNIIGVVNVINTTAPEDVEKAFAIGAYSVVIGSAITRPQLITKRFVQRG